MPAEEIVFQAGNLYYQSIVQSDRCHFFSIFPGRSICRWRYDMGLRQVREA